MRACDWTPYVSNNRSFRYYACHYNVHALHEDSLFESYAEELFHNHLQHLSVCFCDGVPAVGHRGVYRCDANVGQYLGDSTKHSSVDGFSTIKRKSVVDSRHPLFCLRGEMASVQDSRVEFSLQARKVFDHVVGLWDSSLVASSSWIITANWRLYSK